MIEYIMREIDCVLATKQEIVGTLVRCKDCKHRQGNACDYSAVWVRPNGFCQWGEKKDVSDMDVGKMEESTMGQQNEVEE